MPPRRVQQEDSWNSLHHSEASGDVSNDEFAFSEDASMADGDESQDEVGQHPYGLPSPPTVNEVQQALHPLQTAADRVGKQVEDFAEGLDRLTVKMFESQSGKKRDCRDVLPFVQSYKKIASDTVQHLQTVHSPQRQRRLSSQEKKTRSQARDATPTAKRRPTRAGSAMGRGLTNIDDLRRWEQEEQTWDLLGSMLQLTYPGPESEQSRVNYSDSPRPGRKEELHDYSTEKELWSNLLATDDLAWERHTILEWLQRTADQSRPDIDQVIDELEMDADRGSGIVAHSWLYTREALKGQKRLRSWPRAFEPSDPGLDTSLLDASKTNPLVTQLDPDAMTRQGRALEKQDMFFEKATWLACWEMLRRGYPWRSIQDWCNERAEYWRSISACGDIRLQDVDDVDWKSRLLWRKTCALASKDGGIDDYERAVYGTLGGYLPSVHHVSQNWDDEMFAHYNAYLIDSFERFVRTSFPGRIPSLLSQGNGAFSVSAFAGQRALSGHQLVEKLKLSEKTKAEARDPFKMVQGSLIAKNFDEFVFKHGVKLCQAANASGTSKILAPMSDTLIDESVTASITMKDYDILRLITHIILIYQDLGHDFGEGDRRFAMENFIVAYVDYLSKAGKQQLLPLYASRLSRNRYVECLGRQLPSVHVHEDRRTLMSLMRHYDIDIPSVLFHSTTMMLEEATTDSSDEFDPVAYPKLKILGPATQNETQLRAVANNFIGQHVTSDQGNLIHGFEWYMLLDGFWQQTMAVGVMIYKYFLRGQSLAAARQLAQTVPFSHISLTKSDGLLGKIVDISQNPDSEEEEGGPASPVAKANPTRKQGDKRARAGASKSSFKKLEREVLLEESAAFRDFEHLFVALHAMEQWRTYADKVVETSHRTTGPALKQLIGPFKIAFKHVEDAMQPLLHRWLQTARTDKEAADFKQIRLACLPETILAYNSILNFSAHYAGREILKTSMDLSIWIAKEGSDLATCLIEAGRMPEMVDSFAVVAKSMIVAEGKKPGEKHKDGKTLGLWSAKVPATVEGGS